MNAPVLKSTRPHLKQSGSFDLFIHCREVQTEDQVKVIYAGKARPITWVGKVVSYNSNSGIAKLTLEAEKAPPASDNASDKQKLNTGDIIEVTITITNQTTQPESGSTIIDIVLD